MNNSVLSEKDYNILARRVEKILNPSRITSIRSNLNFRAPSYKVYLSKIKDQQDDLCDSEGDGINTVIFSLSHKFNHTYFHNFENEYLRPMAMWPISPDTLVKDYDDVDGGALDSVLMEVPKDQYRSLVFASYQISQELKRKYDISSLKEMYGDIEVLVDFFVPTDPSGNYDITIVVHLCFLI